MRILLIFVFLSLTFSQSYAQELRPKVSITTEKLGSGVNPELFKNLKEQITEFLSFTKFTEKVYAPEERITCSFDFTVEKALGNDGFEVTLYVSASRPVYQTAYQATVFRALDKQVEITVNAATNLEFTNSFYRDNLSSILCFYANMIIGFDENSFELKGGDKHFEIALDIANSAQSSLPNASNWSATDNTTNRYTLVNQIVNNNKYDKIHQFYYTLHREVLDVLTTNQEEALDVFYASIKEIEDLKYFSNDYLPKTIFEIKAEEIRNLALALEDNERLEVKKNMQALNPANNGRFWNSLGKKAPMNKPSDIEPIDNSKSIIMPASGIQNLNGTPVMDANSLQRNSQGTTAKRIN
ncbi:MAG: DUF4835 family protein [Flavobacteriales bacterium]|jgi:hypothetical protein|nr:DUF4835 family protein [Flavobacteriales bacterium]